MLTKGQVYRITASTVHDAYVGTLLEAVEVKNDFGQTSMKVIDPKGSNMAKGSVIQLTQSLHTFEPVDQLADERARILKLLEEVDEKIANRNRIKVADLANGTMIATDVGLGSADIKHIVIVKDADAEWVPIFPTKAGGTSKGATAFPDDTVQGFLDNKQDRNLVFLSGEPDE